jgi:hypothetical protein
MPGKFRISATIWLCISYPFFLTAQDSKNVSEIDTVAAEERKYVKKSAKILHIAAPSAMIVYGVLSFHSEPIRKLDYSTRNELLKNDYMWYDKWDTYLQFAPAAAAFGLKLSGVQSTHKLSDMLIIYGLSNALESGLIYGTKHIVKRIRPDASDHNSFPSGHTATAFAAAEFLHQEYKDRSVWISVAGYGMATLVGASRIYNNKHWVSDVAAGAGIGILSTKIVYWTYPHLQKVFCKKERKVTSVLLPTYSDGNFGFSLTCIF